jgi:hypothetical protein
MRSRKSKSAPAVRKVSSGKSARPADDSFPVAAIGASAFSQMDLVACRNLLIYIQPILQKKIIPILHYALKSSGFLNRSGAVQSTAIQVLRTVGKKIQGMPMAFEVPHFSFCGLETL